MQALAIRCWSASAMLALVSATASAGISQSTIFAPGGFAQAGAYSATNGGGMTPGEDMAGNYGTPQNFSEQDFAGVSSAQAFAAYSGGSISNNANATANLGVFRPFAQNSSPHDALFALGIAAGGWKESLTLGNAALTGQTGYLVFQIRARGSLHTTGYPGAATLTFSPYLSQQVLVANPFYTNTRGYWGIATEGYDAEADSTVDDVVTFGAPFTFGQPFTLGVYVIAKAGMRSVSGSGLFGTGRSDFSGEGVTWNGIVNILNAAGQPVAGSTIVSGSGINWTGPFAPYLGVGPSGEPAGMSIRLASATPCAGEVRLSLFLPHAASARVGVYDVSGRQIRALANGWYSPGRTELVWDGRTTEGQTAGAGIYFVRAEWEGHVAAKRLVRVR